MQNLNRYAHLGPLLLRYAVGILFIAHGFPKLGNPAGVAGFFGTIGIPAPYAMALFVGLVETVGGVLLLIGVGTRIAAALLAGVMVVAMATAKRGKPFVGGWELDFVLLAALVSLVLTGPVGVRPGERSRV